MKDTGIATYAPIRVSTEFSFTDGNQVATATFEFPSGEIPTEDDVRKAARKVLEQVRDQLGEGFWWQTRHGFLTDEFAARTGGVRLAIPGPDVWKAEWAE